MVFPYFPMVFPYSFPMIFPFSPGLSDHHVHVTGRPCGCHRCRGLHRETEDRNQLHRGTLGIAESAAERVVAATLLVPFRLQLVEVVPPEIVGIRNGNRVLFFFRTHRIRMYAI